MPRVTRIILQKTQVHTNNKANHYYLVGRVYKVCKDRKESEEGTAVLTGFHGGIPNNIAFLLFKGYSTKQQFQVFFKHCSDADSCIFSSAGVCNLWFSRCSWTTLPISPCQNGQLGFVVHEHLESRRLQTPALVDPLHSY
uniref:Uncharacterized protein n=1 Tax=Sphaerodactylus townsendi TaxID=933632 RepID=A0ACB8FNF1_9SAUR